MTQSRQSNIRVSGHRPKGSWEEAISGPWARHLDHVSQPSRDKGGRTAETHNALGREGARAQTVRPILAHFSTWFFFARACPRAATVSESELLCVAQGYGH